MPLIAPDSFRGFAKHTKSHQNTPAILSQIFVLIGHGSSARFATVDHRPRFLYSIHSRAGWIKAPGHVV
jgi:hypothetical protein